MKVLKQDNIGWIAYIFFQILPSLQSYRMKSAPRGFALVISNVTFDSGAAPDLDPRKGGEVDDEVLRKIFTELDYLVSVRRDLTAQVRLRVTVKF